MRGRERTGHASMYFDRLPFNLNPPSLGVWVYVLNQFLYCVIVDLPFLPGMLYSWNEASEYNNKVHASLYNSLSSLTCACNNTRSRVPIYLYVHTYMYVHLFK